MTIESRGKSSPRHHPPTDSRTIVRHLQRSLVPFFSSAQVHERLSKVQAAKVLPNTGSDWPRTFELVPALNACLFEHPAFFNARELRAFQEEHLFWERRQYSQSGIARYRIEQRVTVAHRNLMDDGLIQLWIPAPRDVNGVQRVRLLAAHPAGLSEHYLPSAGQIYGAPLLIEPGQPIPQLRLVFEVEQTCAPFNSVPDYDFPPEPVQQPEAVAAAAWMKKVALKWSTPMTAQTFVDLLVDRMEEQFKFAVSARSSSPVITLLESGGGDVFMHTRLLAAALSVAGIVTRLTAAQRLMLIDGHAVLRYPGSIGYDHVFLEWRDTNHDERGCVDLHYLERWCYAATKANAVDDGVRMQLEMLGRKGRAWLRRQVYPIDLILAGSVPQSRMHSFSLNEGYRLYPPIDLKLEAWRLP